MPCIEEAQQRGTGTLEAESHRFAASTGPGQAHLRLLALSDLHMQLMPHDYAADRPVAGRSLALVASEARRAVAEAGNAALFDVGDACEGSPLDAVLAAERDGPHPMSAALAAAGVDAATLGNHDFDHGLATAERIARHSPVPLTLCNLVRRLGARPVDDAPFVAPYLILERELLCGDGARRPVRLGVTGVLPPQTLDWNADTLGGRLFARDAVEAVAAWLPAMRAAGAHLVVVLAHTGIGRAEHVAGMENSAGPLAALDGVDVVLAGHAHRRFPDPDWPPAPAAIDARRGRLHGTPAVMPGCRGEALGVVDLLLEVEDGSGGWRVAASETAVCPVETDRPDAAVAAAARACHERALAAIRRPVARTARPLHTYFALLADSPAVRLVNEAQRAAVRATLPGIAAQEGEIPLLSAAAPHKTGGLHGPDNYTDVPAGEMLCRHLIDLQVYPNRLTVIEVTGAELRLWLERAASVFATVEQGASGAPLLDAAVAGYGFDTIAGLTYRIDPSAPPLVAAWTGRGVPGAADGRVRDLSCDGRPVRAGDRFRLATNSYRLGSHEVYKGLRARAEPVGELTVREALEAFVARGGAEQRLPAAGWALCPIAAARAIYPTGPGARFYPLPEPAGAGILHAAGRDARGFVLYEVDMSRADLLDGDAAAPAPRSPASPPATGAPPRRQDADRTARRAAQPDRQAGPPAAGRNGTRRGGAGDAG
ncbi:5'-nucleotidase C-terminal domain-containing protein [Rhodovulum sp. 12E13]|uniref:5'-nucleotidase C-terminal domain-containing protein n=1 Tax=Rhodovulum sp. 12E13 TaxID=2203891 RepID=UPI001314F76C|nr:5'-nucleotidase C-terminal domain-containing protein [Rhodovulum sp. 12E13]